MPSNNRKIHSLVSSGAGLTNGRNGNRMRHAVRFWKNETVSVGSRVVSFLLIIPNTANNTAEARPERVPVKILIEELSTLTSRKTAAMMIIPAMSSIAFRCFLYFSASMIKVKMGRLRR